MEWGGEQQIATEQVDLKKAGPEVELDEKGEAELNRMTKGGVAS